MGIQSLCHFSINTAHLSQTLLFYGSILINQYQKFRISKAEHCSGKVTIAYIEKLKNPPENSNKNDLHQWFPNANPWGAYITWKDMLKKFICPAPQPRDLRERPNPSQSIYIYIVLLVKA